MDGHNTGGRHDKWGTTDETRIWLNSGEYCSFGSDMWALQVSSRPEFGVCDGGSCRHSQSVSQYPSTEPPERSHAHMTLVLAVMAGKNRAISMSLLVSASVKSVGDAGTAAP